MVILKIVQGDLLDAKEKYICHQCNCNTKKAKGLSKYISDKYSWANIYARRSKVPFVPDTPGKVLQLVHPNQKDYKHTILCFMAQWLPGKPNAYKHCYSTTYDDTYENRKKWFKDCLAILDFNKFDTVAMPYLIGCGLAGGKWDDYKQLLDNCSTCIVLYKLN
jgi:O-acetyl-ADP-ribose deacetylase (regulator of RNase III)